MKKCKSKKISFGLASVLIIGLIGLFVINVATASVGGIWGMIADRAGYYLATSIGSAPQDILENTIGGLVHNVQEEFSAGIKVNGNEVIDKYGKWARSNVEIALSFPATTTHAFTPIVRYDNPTESSLIVSDWYLDLTTALGGMAGEVNCGTTTEDTSGSLVATSSQTLLSYWWVGREDYTGKAAGDFISPQTATSTGVIGSYFGAIGDNRTPTSTAFVLAANTSFVCSLTPTSTATSGDWSTSARFTGAGKLHLETRRR